MMTQHIGYGRFQLQDFAPGEVLARFDGSLAIVCDPQPITAPADRIQVWVDYGSANARKEYLHRTALAHATSEEQAWRIERRRQRQEETP